MMAFMIKLVGLYGFAFSRQIFFWGEVGSRWCFYTLLNVLCHVLTVLAALQQKQACVRVMVEEKTGGEGEEAWR